LKNPKRNTRGVLTTNENAKCNEKEKEKENKHPTNWVNSLYLFRKLHQKFELIEGEWIMSSQFAHI